MLHEQSHAYFDAALHATKVLGGDANGCFLDKLLKLSRSGLRLEELKIVADAQADANKPRKPKQPIQPLAGTRWGQFTLLRPARRFAVLRDGLPSGLTSRHSGCGAMWLCRCSCGKFEKVSLNDSTSEFQRKCRRCVAADRVAASTKALEVAAGNMVKAQGMWLQYEKFVRFRVGKECQKYTEQPDRFCSDLESMVWAAVCKRVHTYHDRGLKHGPMAWLKAVVFSVSNDFFKGLYAECRDEKKNVELENEDGTIHTWADSGRGRARKTSPSGYAPDFESENLAASLASGTLRISGLGGYHEEATTLEEV